MVAPLRLLLLGSSDLLLLVVVVFFAPAGARDRDGFCVSVSTSAALMKLDKWIRGGGGGGSADMGGHL